MDKVKDGPNWEDDLAGTFDERKSDPNLSSIDTQGFEEFERTFMFYVPRLCEHCLHPQLSLGCHLQAQGRRGAHQPGPLSWLAAVRVGLSV